MKTRVMLAAVAVAMIPGLASGQCYGGYRTQVGGVTIYSTAPPSVFYVGQTEPYWSSYGFGYWTSYGWRHHRHWR
ncbi:MAG TPA: hypothetical protein VHE55_10200 [Fimbriimonadaceae bacterium]|nr:hypothetical protein [Fimbriimonadaceae bacterium]